MHEHWASELVLVTWTTATQLLYLSGENMLPRQLSGDLPS